MASSSAKMMEYEPVIGLEVHLQLKTETKLFCGCPTLFGAPPNSHTCPVCLGLPGVLPVLNERAFDWGIRVALAFECEIAGVMKFDRKQYFYPDLPKNYQISQYAQPLARQGHLDVPVEGQTTRVRIHRIHLEEDAGKLLHEASPTESFVDFNRAGVPLLEIVSEPDLRSAEDAYHYLVDLKAVIQYLDVSTCNMEEGSLRCDTNVSVRPKGSRTLGAKVEVKNLNSFRAVKLAVEHEIKRQTLVLEGGQRLAQETRLWNAQRQETQSMRSKEEAADYRYFPEPDLVPFLIDAKRVETLRATLPELPAQRRLRYQTTYGLSAYDANVLTQDRALADFFEATVRLFPQPKPVANWIMGDLLAYLNAEQRAFSSVTFHPEWLVRLLQLMNEGTLSGRMAKEVLHRALARGVDPAQIVQEEGLQQVVDPGALERIAEEVLAAFPRSVEDYKKGKVNALMYLVGQGMKRSQGQANPQQMTDVLKRKLEAVGAKG